MEENKTHLDIFFQVNYVDLSGPSVVMNVIEVEGGGLWLRPIRGDALRHVYIVPQVEHYHLAL